MRNLPNKEDARRWLLAQSSVRSALSWAKAHALPGFAGLPVYDVYVFVAKEAKRHALVTRSNAVAFSFMLSLFPSTIVLLTIVPYLPIDNFVNALENSLRDILPVQTEQAIIKAIRGVTDKPRGGLLSLGFVLAIFFASNGMMALMQGFKRGYASTFRPRSALKERMVAINLTLLMGTLFILSIGLVIGGNLLMGELVKYIKADWFTSVGLDMFRWLAVIFLFYSGISTIYRYGPATRRKFRFFSPGATLATMLSLLTSVGFSFFVDNFGNYNQVYGSISAILILMIWLQINSFILLAGFDLNTSIAVHISKQLYEDAESEEGADL